MTEGLELPWGNVVKEFWQRLAVTWVFVALLPGPNTGRQQDLLEADSSRGPQEPTSASQNSAPGETKGAPDTESRRIQNIAPEEMWNRVTECFFPQYPQLAVDTHITGTVNIGLGVTPQGDIGDRFRVLDGHPLLVQSAIDAIRQWKFRPNEVQGEVTWSRVRALVRFNAD